MTDSNNSYAGGAGSFYGNQGPFSQNQGSNNQAPPSSPFRSGGGFFGQLLPSTSESNNQAPPSTIFTPSTPGGGFFGQAPPSTPGGGGFFGQAPPSTPGSGGGFFGQAPPSTPGSGGGFGAPTSSLFSQFSPPRSEPERVAPPPLRRPTNRPLSPQRERRRPQNLNFDVNIPDIRSPIGSPRRIGSPNLSPIGSPRSRSPRRNPLPVAVQSSRQVSGSQIGTATVRSLVKTEFNLDNYDPVTLSSFYSEDLPLQWKIPERYRILSSNANDIKAHFITTAMNLGQSVSEMFDLICDDSRSEDKCRRFLLIGKYQNIPPDALGIANLTESGLDVLAGLRSVDTFTTQTFARYMETLGLLSFVASPGISSENINLIQRRIVDIFRKDAFSMRNLLRDGSAPLYQSDLLLIARIEKLNANPYAKELLRRFYRTSPEDATSINEWIEERLFSMTRPRDAEEMINYAANIGIRIPLHKIRGRTLSDAEVYINSNIVHYRNIQPGSTATEKMTDFQILERLNVVFTYQSRLDLINKARAFVRQPDYVIPFFPKSKYYAQRANNLVKIILSTHDDFDEVIEEGTALAWGNLNSAYFSAIDELNTVWANVTNSFPHPQWYNSGLAATPQLSQVLVREMLELLNDIPPSEASAEIAELILKISSVLENMIALSQSEEANVQRYRSFSEEDRNKINEYFMNVFYAGMRMRQWKGPGHPYPYSSAASSGYERELRNRTQIPENQIQVTLNSLRQVFPFLTQDNLAAFRRRLEATNADQYPEVPVFNGGVEGRARALLRDYLLQDITTKLASERLSASGSESKIRSLETKLRRIRLSLELPREYEEDAVEVALNRVEALIWRGDPNINSLDISLIKNKLEGARAQISTDVISGVIETLATGYMARMDEIRSTMSPEAKTLVDEIPTMNIQEGVSGNAAYQAIDNMPHFVDLLNIVKLGTGSGLTERERESLLSRFEGEVPITSCQRLSSTKFVATAGRFFVVYTDQAIPDFNPGEVSRVQ